MSVVEIERRRRRRHFVGRDRRRHHADFLWSRKRDEDKMEDAELLEDIHHELEERRVRISKIALALALLALVGLWCWCQVVLS